MIVDKTTWQTLRTWGACVRKSIGSIHSIWHPGSLLLTTEGQRSDGSTPIPHDHATEQRVDLSSSGSGPLRTRARGQAGRPALRDHAQDRPQVADPVAAVCRVCRIAAWPRSGPLVLLDELFIHRLDARVKRGGMMLICIPNFRITGVFILTRFHTPC